MKLNLNDHQLELLLECVAKYHVILAMQCQDNKEIEDIITSIAESLKEVNKQYIFNKIYQEM